MTLVERSGLLVSLLVSLTAVLILLLRNCMLAVNYFQKKGIRFKMVGFFKVKISCFLKHRNVASNQSWDIWIPFSYSETYFVIFEIFIFWSLSCEHIQQLGLCGVLKKVHEKSQFQWIGQRFHSLQQAACITGWESVLRFRTSNLFFGTRRVMSFPELCDHAGKFRKLGFLNNQLYLKAQEMTLKLK